ncbi:hypothetical protein BRADI_5g15593v3 [Brachypodium distachyon]|uniref:Rx N-terminal domain-containing protein n=1 Tax=Brachypodium distachyon TaxID=15368 RepID=A0A0Q3E6X5_BRADI|nr:hypothetical protein BRADI_5g15593v3 [Brachypodium distachyon]
MAVGIVVTIVVQEGLSRVVTHVLGKREERASMEENLERLEWAHSKMKSALERSIKLPMTDESLLSRQRAIKRAYHQCDELLSCKRQALDDDTVVAEQGKITLAVGRWVSSFLCMNEDKLSRSAVRRFERRANKSDKFMSKVDSCCTLARYRFFCPLIPQLLRGEKVEYVITLANRTHHFWILELPTASGGDGMNEDKLSCSVVRRFERRANESDKFMSKVDSCCTLARYRFFCPLIPQLLRGEKVEYVIMLANRTHLFWILELVKGLFPEQVIAMRFQWCISFVVVDQHNRQSSPYEADRNAVNDWPLLDVSAQFRPHYFRKMKRDTHVLELIGEHEEYMDGISLLQVEEMAVTNAISSFIRQPELTKY